jgi:hypothetical protein
MSITADQFDEVRKVLERYTYRHQLQDRGPGCRACARCADGHSAKDQPVCLTVTELLYDLESLIEIPSTPSCCYPHTLGMSCCCGCHNSSGSSKGSNDGK